MIFQSYHIFIRILSGFIYNLLYPSDKKEKIETGQTFSFLRCQLLFYAYGNVKLSIFPQFGSACELLLFTDLSQCPLEYQTSVI